MPLTLLICLAALAVVGGLILETAHLRRCRKKLLHVIHVNGIRGKSTTARLIAAGLRACGVKTACKTTGTVPVYSGPDGVEHPITRMGPANIREQKRTLYRAVRDGADVLVIECMAVSPELQALCQHRILQADVCVMTKILPDHTDVLGESEEAIARSLSNTIPVKGRLITLPDNCGEVFAAAAEPEDVSVILAPPVPPCGMESIDRFPENLQLALAAADGLGLPRDAFLEGLRGYTPDPFSFEVITAGSLTLYNAFSANDPASIMSSYASVLAERGGEPLTVLLNARADRPGRTLQHVEMLIKMRPRRVLLMGDSLLSIRLRLERAGLETKELTSIDALLEEEAVFACGNIHGKGQKLINYLKEGGGTHG